MIIAMVRSAVIVAILLILLLVVLLLIFILPNSPSLPLARLALQPAGNVINLDQRIGNPLSTAQAKTMKLLFIHSIATEDILSLNLAWLVSQLAFSEELLFVSILVVDEHSWPSIPIFVKLRNPVVNVLSLGIIVNCLLNRIEHSAGGTWVISDPGNILPITPVAADVVVDKQILIPLCTQTPVNAKMLREITGDVLTCSVRGVASKVQLTLARIN